MLGKCSTEALRHQDQVNLNPSSVTLNHFRGRRRHLVVREVPRSNRFLLPLQNITDMADYQIYLCKNIAKTGSYYHGHGQSWEAVADTQKPCQDTVESLNDFLALCFDKKVEADHVIKRLTELAPSALLNEQHFFMGWGLRRWKKSTIIQQLMIIR